MELFYWFEIVISALYDSLIISNTHIVEFGFEVHKELKKSSASDWWLNSFWLSYCSNISYDSSALFSLSISKASELSVSSV